MGILNELDSPGHITEAAAHCNHASDLRDSGGTSVEIAKALFDALNKLQDEWLSQRTGKEPLGEMPAFRQMILGLTPDARITFLQSVEHRSFVDLTPQVMNHSTLRDNNYRPDVEMDPELAKKARKDHKNLVNAYRNAERDESVEAEIRVVKRTSDLLYVVRSNLAHGEKTPSGPDREKIERDKTVCSVAVPLQRILIDFLLDCPSKKLVAYGTLAPGGPNYELIQDIPGVWERCKVRGSISISKGLPRLTWNTNGPDIDTNVLLSEQLPEKWPMIDAFEGNAYKRRLIIVSINGQTAVPNTYL